MISIKQLIILLSLSLAPKLMALEIQCQTPWSDLLMVIKTSPQTSTTYLLFMNDEEVVEKLWPLSSESLEISEEQIFFRDEETKIFVDLLKMGGKIESEFSLIRGESAIELFSCASYK